MGVTQSAVSGRQLGAALGATIRQNLAAADGGHTRTEAMTMLADEFGWLIRALHDDTPASKQVERCNMARSGDT
jgi:hypothetical protein